MAGQPKMALQPAPRLSINQQGVSMYSAASLASVLFSSVERVYSLPSQWVICFEG